MNNSAAPARSGFIRIWQLVLLIAAAVFSGIVYWFGLSPKHEALDSGLVISANDLDVGDLWEQRSFQCKMSIQNTVAHDIVIDGFHSTCGCTSIEPSTLTIPSGQKADVDVTLNLKLGLRQDINDFQIQISPFRRDASRPLASWTIRGRARRLLNLRPAKVSFYGKELVQEQPFPTQTVTATTSIQVDSLLAKCPPDLASVEVIPSKQHANEFEIVIAPAKTLPTGPFRFEILLEPKSGATHYPSLPLLVEGKVTSDVHALPDSLVIGPGRVGETLSESITLRSASGAPFEVIKIDTSSHDVAVESANVPGLFGKSFRIVQQVTKAGTHSSSVRFSLRKKSGGNSTVLVKIICLGTSG